MMRKCISFLLVFSMLPALSGAQVSIERPKLVVGIVIDQMRWDYLYRFYDRYGNDGFKRLMHEGYNCQNTTINYIPSYTGPGHACIYTGSVPSIHGIASNDWIDNISGQQCYCVQDELVKQVDKSAFTSMSPRNLLVTTVTDELRLATNMSSRVYGIAIKDRGSILPAGHLANAAYWYDDNTGNFTSSTYYVNSLPNWLQTFNKKNLADSLTKQNWELLYATDAYTQSTADDNKYESPFKGEKVPVFPHVVNNLSLGDRYKIIKSLPAGNVLSLEMAKACIAGEQLGLKGSTDFLCVSLSSTDYIGHQFGPNSVEVEDLYLRLDKDIASFLTYLDKSFGKGNYLLFISADHGAAHNASFLKDHNIPAGFVSQYVTYNLKKFVQQTFGKDSIVRAVSNYQVYLNDSFIRKAGLNRNKIKQAICDWFNKDSAIAYAIDMENIGKAAMPEPIMTMAINGYNKKRSGCIQLIYNPGWYEGFATCTTHGTWNPYDTHIPLLWYGWHIPKGETYETIHMTDIAPTLAALLHIQMPNGCIGLPINAILKK